jgi:hypothetical protein
MLYSILEEEHEGRKRGITMIRTMGMIESDCSGLRKLGSSIKVKLELKS